MITPFIAYSSRMLITNFNKAIDEWINSVWDYSSEELYIQPSQDNWSAGQLCMHLVKDTNWYIEQMKTAASVNFNQDKAMDKTAKIMFLNNAFPDAELINPANENMPQPESKVCLLKLLFKLKTDMNDIALELKEVNLQGKTQHPGLGYFNATEWLQFAVMHLCHHLKQKQKIEEYLKQYNDK